MEITIRVDRAGTGGDDQLARLGEIVLRTPILHLGSLDRGLVESQLTIGGRRYVVSDLDVKPGAGSDAAVTIEITPAENDPFDETREERQPEW